MIKDSIYSRKLVLRGELVPESLRGDLQFTRTAASIMSIVRTATRLHDLPKGTNEAFVVAEDDGALGGVVTGEGVTEIGDADTSVVIGVVAQRNYAVLSPDDSVWKAVASMRSTASAFALGCFAESRSVSHEWPLPPPDRRRTRVPRPIPDFFPDARRP